MGGTGIYFFPGGEGKLSVSNVATQSNGREPLETFLAQCVMNVFSG